MIKSLSVTSLILISIFSSAQTWSPPGANWKYTYFWGNATGYVEIKYINDTVINGQNIKILEKSQTTFTKFYILLITLTHHNQLI